MKLCRECRKEIDPAARRCPYCQASQYGWPRRYLFLTTFAVCVVGLVLLNLLGSHLGSWQVRGPNATKATQLVPTPTPTPAASLTPTDQSRQETQALIDQVSPLIALPPADIANGEPTLATVLDLSKLADQPFFANAQNGDKVLIYTQAKKAFLYRPSTHQIINVAPVTTGMGQ